MFLIVGLGNPGKQYESTRHNIGFMVVDALAADAAWKNEAKFKAELTEISMNDTKVLLAKPQTFMNDSGQAVQAIASFYKVEPDHIIIIHDDIDIEFGKLRVRQGGGDAGHNGIKSIYLQHSEQIVRFRLGVGNSELKNPIPTDRFVLAPFNTSEKDELPKFVDASANEIKAYIASPNEYSKNLLAT